MNLYNYLYNYVVLTCKKYNIDESHAIKHSMDVFYISNRIFEMELIKKPHLEKYKTILDISSILHDMCDKKYMAEADGINNIIDYLKNTVSENDLDISLKIMSTMSYSTVKKNGFPSLGEYQDIYDCVREADLLTSYDFDRCIIYDMYKNNNSYETSFILAKTIFQERMLLYIQQNLFKTEYAKIHAPKLEKKCQIRINSLERMLKNGKK
jgi:hypothetical protein